MLKVKILHSAAANQTEAACDKKYKMNQPSIKQHQSSSSTLQNTFQSSQGRIKVLFSIRIPVTFSGASDMFPHAEGK